MSTEQPLEDVASTHEVTLALANLSAADLLRVKQIAKMRSAGLKGVDWEDLVNEAVSRALAGTRRWPRKVPFIAFLAQTIRSVSSEEWRRLGQQQVTLESEMMSADVDTPIALSDIAADPIDPEREVIARKTLGEIEALFHGDHEAIEVLRGLAQGLTPEEIQSAAALTPTQYSSAQKRIRRCLARHFLAKEK